jgi:hypothetical protein
MISPESGIHRPSYNGAPAKQTKRFLNEAMNCPASSNNCDCKQFKFALNVCERSARIAHNALL